MSLGTEKPEVFLDFAGKVACLCVFVIFWNTHLSKMLRIVSLTEGPLG